MHSLLGSLGAVGLAGALTVLLLLGTTTGGKVRPLGWGVTLFLAMVAGSAYEAAGTPFNLVSYLVNDLIGLTGHVVAGYSMPALALTLLFFILYKKMTTRQVAILGIAFFYVAAGAGGGWGIIAEKVNLIMQSVA